jgi:hypothetical protein
VALVEVEMVSSASAAAKAASTSALSVGWLAFTASR